MFELLASFIRLFPNWGDGDLRVIIQFGDKIKLTMYAVCILTGAVLALYRCKSILKKDGLDPTLYDNFFLMVIPISVIGCRIWYVIGEWSRFANDFSAIFKIWDGGLAIQGGVMAGLLFGFIYFKNNKTKVNMAYHFDTMVPTILIGQALGRWGNFFNKEVYGKCVDKSLLWMFPNFILDNTAGVSCVDTTQTQIPLFLVESIINIIGFILLSYILRKYWKKYRKPFVLCCLYLVWYGVVRATLEPLRNPLFIMSPSGDPDAFAISSYTSYFFILAGLIGIVLCYVLQKNVDYDNIYLNKAFIAESEKKDIALEKEREEVVKQAILDKQNHVNGDDEDE